MHYHHDFKHHNILYVLDLICMSLAVGLVGFCLYIAPFVLFGYQSYDVPLFVMQVAHWYETHHGLKDFLLILIVFGPVILASAGFIYISRLISYYLELAEDVEEAIEEGGIERAAPALPKPKREHPGLKQIFVIATLMLSLIGLLVLAETFLFFDLLK